MGNRSFHGMILWSDQLYKQRSSISLPKRISRGGGFVCLNRSILTLFLSKKTMDQK